MISKTQPIKLKHLTEHETKRHLLIKFFILLVILIGYAGYMTYQYGFTSGSILTVITWSFFVLCTPVADAGMLLDFPIRLLFRLKMFLSELAVWVIAIAINIYILLTRPEIYDKFPLGHIFYKILTNPIPYWSIILLSFFGTFLSVHFADKLMDFVNHSDIIKKGLAHQLIFEGIVITSIFLLILFVYNIVIEKFGIDINNF